MSDILPPLPQEVSDAIFAWGKALHEWVLAPVPDNDDESDDPMWDRQKAVRIALELSIRRALAAARNDQ